MEFTVVTHDPPAPLNDTPNQSSIANMFILSMPDALLVYTSCNDKEQFASAMVNLSFGYDYTGILQEHRYCSVNGTIVFRHPLSFRTAVMFFVSDKLITPLSVRANAGGAYSSLRKSLKFSSAAVRP